MTSAILLAHMRRFLLHGGSSLGADVPAECLRSPFASRFPSGGLEGGGGPPSPACCLASDACCARQLRLWIRAKRQLESSGRVNDCGRGIVRQQLHIICCCRKVYTFTVPPAAQHSHRREGVRDSLTPYRRTCTSADRTTSQPASCRALRCSPSGRGSQLPRACGAANAVCTPCDADGGPRPAVYCVCVASAKRLLAAGRACVGSGLGRHCCAGTSADRPAIGATAASRCGATAGVRSGTGCACSAAAPALSESLCVTSVLCADFHALLTASIGSLMSCTTQSDGITSQAASKEASSIKAAS